jgi:predicted RecA/RadA family phage recombinase
MADSPEKGVMFTTKSAQRIGRMVKEWEREPCNRTGYMRGRTKFNGNDYSYLYTKGLNIHATDPIEKGKIAVISGCNGLDAEPQVANSSIILDVNLCADGDEGKPWGIALETIAAGETGNIAIEGITFALVDARDATEYTTCGLDSYSTTSSIMHVMGSGADLIWMAATPIVVGGYNYLALIKFPTNQTNLVLSQFPPIPTFAPRKIRFDGIEWYAEPGDTYWVPSTLKFTDKTGEPGTS